MKAPAKKGPAKTTKAKPKKKGGRNRDESMDSDDSLNDFICGDEEIEYAKKGRKKAQTKR